MNIPWCRIYAELRTDPKVRTMPEPYQLRLIWLFLLRCAGPTENLSREELLFGLSCDETFLAALHAAFHAKGFIEDNWAVRNWNKRQFVSDSSTERVRKFRQNRTPKQDETLPKRRETQNETDQNRTEQNRTEEKPPAPPALEPAPRVHKSDLESIYDAYPRKVGKDAALKAIYKALRRIAPDHDALWLLDRTSAYAETRRNEDPQFTPHPATWFNQGRYLDESLQPKPKTLWVRADGTPVEPANPKDERFLQ